MKYLASFFFVVFSSTIIAQQIDYNTKKGFVANGFDVVSYFDNKPLKGNSKFETTHDGAKYRFSSEINLELFKVSPEKYVPQYGGYCAYAVAARKIKMGSDPETFEIRDEKLYLFYNSWGNNTLNKWTKGKTKELQETADSNWEKIKFKK